MVELYKGIATGSLDTPDFAFVGLYFRPAEDTRRKIFTTMTEMAVDRAGLVPDIPDVSRPWRLVVRVAEDVLRTPGLLEGNLGRHTRELPIFKDIGRVPIEALANLDNAELVGFPPCDEIE